MAAGSDAVRRLDLARRPPVHGVDPEPVRDQRRPVHGRHAAAADVHRDAPTPSRRQRDDRRRLAVGDRHHVSAAVRMARGGSVERRRRLHADAGSRLRRLLGPRILLRPAGMQIDR